MRLSDHDLSQLTEEELLALPEDVVRKLSVKLLVDLKEARERLKQNSSNSSMPPRTDKPWGNDDKQEDGDADQNKALPTEKNPPPHDAADNTDQKEVEPKDQTNTDPKPPRKPGKQPGATGYGRTQVIAITDEVHHYPTACAICDRDLNPYQADAIAHNAFETVDIVWADPSRPGIQLTNVRHVYYKVTCQCGHCTQQMPHREPTHPSTPNITLSEWRLVGPGLAALLVCLAYRMRLSRGRIQEFLYDWLGLSLGVGTINATLHESGGAALAVEEELVQAVQDSNLLHVDETPWPESKVPLWLWVFCGQYVVAYWVATRRAELLMNVLGETFDGWLMSDGLQVYRQYLQRLRCWAHLIRKAKGLEESLDTTARQFGRQTMTLLNILMDAIYSARQKPPDKPLMDTYRSTVADYRRTCETMRDTATHEKTRQLAGEMLNDWEAIFCVLAHPHLPLTNNEAEQALRHWVILRGICHGTRTEEGSAVFAILISIIETCRVRHQSPWVYLAALVDQRRKGLPAPRLPVPLKKVRGSE